MLEIADREILSHRELEIATAHYGASLETAVRADVSPEEAIMGAAEAGRDLIVMGANRRAGSPLNLGEVAASVLRGSKASVALITN